MARSAKILRMGKKVGLVVIGALLLTGCASTNAASSPEPTAEESPATTPSAAPLKVASPATEPVEDPNDAFLKAVKEGWIGDPPSDQEIKAAGEYACTQYPTGLAYDEIVAVEGEGWQAADNNLKVTVNAARYYCPEFNPDAN